MFDPLKAKTKLILYTALAFLFGLGLASSLDWTEGSFAGVPFQDLSLQAESPVPAQAVEPAMDMSRAFIAVADAVTPGVVRIQVSSAGQRQAPHGLEQIPEEFRRFFGPPRQRGPAPPRIRGGSGFIATSDGYILTNNHVVEGADEIQVWLRDGRHFYAELVGTDPTTDIAVVKIDATDLPALKLGSSETSDVGEWVLALGNPGFGGSSQLDYTLTAGIVSAKHRSIGIIQQTLMEQGRDTVAQYAIEDFIQTDAVINPGNSGGPLIDLQGEVIGVNSAISSLTGYYMGYGFAVPIDLAEKVMADIIEHGEVQRPWLGIQITGVTPEDAEAFDLPQVAGALVQSLPDGSPAGGTLRQGDVIVAIDGKDVATVGQLQQRIARFDPGETVTVTFFRDGDRDEAEITLGEAPFSTDEEVTASAPEAGGEKLGITVQELTPRINEQLGYPDADGVVISGVRPYGPAARHQLSPGLKLLEVDGRPIERPDDVEEALRDVSGGDVVTLRVGRPDGSSQIVNVRIPR